MFLFINTIESNQLELALFDFSGRKKCLRTRFSSPRNDKILILLESLLKKARLKPTKINGIAVLVGQGSFTGIRLGLTIANMFGFLLNIPVIGVKSAEESTIKMAAKQLARKKKFVPLKPVYEKEPNITLFKK
jgi:tRNA A37 threonylcarbamoyladenosine modification protein TsaB